MKGIVLFLLMVTVFGVGCGEDEVMQPEKVETPPTTQMQPESQPMEKAQPTGAVKAFVIEADDQTLDPKSIEVNAGDTVKITFKVRNQRVAFGGLEFRSEFFKSITVAPGDSKTVEFTAPNKNFTFSSFWPKSNRKKMDGKVIVKA
ncbi:cupredoxin domain-containing protein [Candidatus Poribacteria bacterium]|nr:cupredoxin domain-containing protein [Candidatus Poribacteria bacterium]